MRHLVIFSALMLSGIGSAQALDCAKFIAMHGQASRAQFQCGFDQYNNAVIEQARACFPQLGEAKLKQSLMTGMKRFDADERKFGHAAACEMALRAFPNFVRR